MRRSLTFLTEDVKHAFCALPAGERPQNTVQFLANRAELAAVVACAPSITFCAAQSLSFFSNLL